MIHITNNPSQLTDAEVKVIQDSEWFDYVYGVGIIYLSNGTWDCSNTVSAKEYLVKLGKRERAINKHKL